MTLSQPPTIDPALRDPDDPLIGHSLMGRYRVRRLLGEGSMARVYMADQVSVGREVAVKILRPELMSDESAETRFRREVEAVARLTSPHAIQLYDYGETASGYHFIVMEYLRGETLRNRLDRSGALPMGEALSIVAQIASALGEAHAAGIIHRDLKPENIHFADCPSPLAPFAKVLDFGLSKMQEPKGSVGSITERNTTVGTPAYLAPEAATVGRVTDWRSDLYSLGVIAFEMLTGIRPFGGRSALETMIAHVRDPIPSACKLRPELAANVDLFFTHVLVKDPKDRLASAALVAQSLAAALNGVYGQSA